MDNIPVIIPDQLKQVKDPKTQKHLTSYVDGKASLLDIATRMGRDPVKVAKTYHGWHANGLLRFRNSTEIDQNLPIVLSVDDSPIIQVMIKRSLKGFCNVLLTDNVEEALEILNHHPVKVLLLDLTMPGVDGLEFCQRIRKNPKFQHLPIVMVTARDGLVNRAKGHFAGTSKYLTKPFKPEELQEVVRQYIEIYDAKHS